MGGEGVGRVLCVNGDPMWVCHWGLWGSITPGTVLLILLLGNSGALEVLIVSVRTGEQVSVTGLVDSQMVTSRAS